MKETKRIDIIPALPGFNVLVPIPDEHGEVTEFVAYPIIAWLIRTSIRDEELEVNSEKRPVTETDSLCVPITPEGDADQRYEQWVVQLPDGRCINKFDRDLRYCR